jgi:hypothetical protein
VFASIQQIHFRRLITNEFLKDMGLLIIYSIQQIHFRRLIKNGFLKDKGLLIIYSDGANYQNRRTTIADAFLLMAKTCQMKKTNMRLSNTAFKVDQTRQ